MKLTNETIKVNVIITFAVILFTTLSFAQNSIVAAGNETYTVGEVFPIMQTVQKQKEVSLSVPKFEIPIEKPKPIVKKKSFIQKLIDLITKIFKK